MTTLRRPDFVNEKDWDLVCYYADKYGVPPALIAAVGWSETHWGQQGVGREWLLGYGVSGQLDVTATFKGFENQIRFGAVKLSQFFKDRPVTHANVLEFARNYWKPEDPVLWAKNVYLTYQKITGGTPELLKETTPYGQVTHGFVPQALQIGDAIEEVPSWFDPANNSYFTRRLEPYREDQHSPIDPTEISYEQIVNMMHHDQVKYSCRGRLLQAFPTFLMMFVDEGEWVGGRKLWDNFYFYHSIVSLDVVKERGNPADVARIELTNVYGALNHRTIPARLEKLTFIQKLFPAITRHSLEMRKRFMNDLLVRPGARIHIRMGYGSSASRLPIIFNGVITEVDTQDLATFVAQGDGHELLNEMIQFSPEEKTGLFKLGNEPTDIIREILCKRGLAFHFNAGALSSLLSTMNRDYAHTVLDKDYTFGASNPFGIEHFGTVRKDQIQLIHTGLDIKTWDVMANVYPLTINMGRLNRYWLELTHNTQKATEEEKEKWYQRLKEWAEEIIGDITDYLDELKTQVFQEPNIGIWLGQKTPWDVFCIISRCTKGYVPAVFPFQFRSSFFHGLPWWPVCIKYVNNPNVGIEQYFTTFQQFHYLSSFTDIIYNDIKASSRYIITNAAAIYTLGKGSELSPIVMADHTIRSDLQKAEVVDSGTVQDIKLLPDKALHWFGVQPGDDRAIAYAQSHVVEKMREMYQGELILRGMPSLKPYDMFFLDDVYSCMYGLAEIGRVIHSISPQTGFITTIKPDLISRHLESAELWGQLYTGLVSAGVWGALYGLRIIHYARTAGFAYLTARAALIGKKVKGAVSAAGKVWKGAVAVKTAVRGKVTAVGAAVGATLGSVVPGLGTTVGALLGSVIVNTAVFGLINGAVKFVQKYFSTRNMVKIYPMFLQDKVYVAGITGAKYLIAYGPYDDLFNPADETTDEVVYGNAGTIGVPGQLALDNDWRFLSWMSDGNGVITSPFGTRYIDGKKEQHKGIDIAFTPKDAPIKAALPGKVVKVKYDANGYGHYVVIHHGAHATLYAHLREKPYVSLGQQVQAGTIIGRQGSTGKSTGPHLHFELMRVEGNQYIQMDPLPYLPPTMYTR